MSHARIVVLRAEDFDTGPTAASETLNERVLNEIGAAFVCFAGRLLLLHEESLPLPAALQSFQCTYRGAELTWASGVKVLRALQGFRSAARTRSTATQR
jgi:sulfate adenylyltransferase subunit 1 (EFTu-like GTPase family)